MLAELTTRKTSVFVTYVDQLLVPQLNELPSDYDVDCVWVDGECWATISDNGERALHLFCELTGISDISKFAADPH